MEVASTSGDCPPVIWSTRAHPESRNRAVSATADVRTSFFTVSPSYRGLARPKLGGGTLPRGESRPC
ncbi:hypothetical protein ACFPRL_24910 [Pseudoclavibacter helvolus]